MRFFATFLVSAAVLFVCAVPLMRAVGSDTAVRFFLNGGIGIAVGSIALIIAETVDTILSRR